MVSTISLAISRHLVLTSHLEGNGAKPGQQSLKIPMASERCTSVNYSRITIRGQPTTCRIHAPRLPGINNPRIYGILDRFVRKDAFIVDRIARIPLPRHYYFNTVIRVSRIPISFHLVFLSFSFFFHPLTDFLVDSSRGIEF